MNNNFSDLSNNEYDIFLNNEQERVFSENNNYETVQIINQNIYLLSKDNFKNKIDISESVDIYFSDYYKNDKIKKEYELLNDFKTKLKDNIICIDTSLKHSYKQINKSNFNTIEKVFDESLLNKEIVNIDNARKQGQQLAPKFAELLPNIILEDHISMYVREPRGQQTAPDIFMKYKGESMFVEIKSVKCEFDKNNNLLYKFNNATNNAATVSDEIHLYSNFIKAGKTTQDFIKFVDLRKKDLTEIDKRYINSRILHETLCIFIYYYVDPVSQITYLFDCDITPMPLALSVNIDPKTNKIKLDNTYGFNTKSNGKNSVNNNVNLSLCLPFIYNNTDNKLIDRLYLLTYNKTFDKNNNYELVTTSLYDYNNNKTIFNNKLNALNKIILNNIDVINPLFIKMAETYYKEIQDINNKLKKYKAKYDYNITVASLYETLKQNYKTFINNIKNKEKEKIKELKRLEKEKQKLLKEKEKELKRLEKEKQKLLKKKSKYKKTK